jgi:NAD-dependent DNA ligase
LQGLCHGILADGQINEAELSGLRAWLDAHRELRKYYPFDELETILEAIVDGGSFGDDESLMLKALFLQYADIREQSVRSMLVGEVGDTYNLKGFCAVSPEIAFEGKRFCFTGESKLATRSQLQGVITRLGGKPENNVVKGLDYLIVGDGGSSCWAFSCYGRKVEKAIELRRAGGPVVIVQERDFWRAAGAKS